jgi:hypothetical protein
VTTPLAEKQGEHFRRQAVDECFQNQVVPANAAKRLGQGEPLYKSSFKIQSAVVAIPLDGEIPSNRPLTATPSKRRAMEKHGDLVAAD